MSLERKIWNERIKLFANTLNALGIGVAALAFIRPSVDEGLVSIYFVGTLVSVGLHLIAQYLMGFLKEEQSG